MAMLRHWDDLADHGDTGAVTRRTLEGEGATLVRVIIEAGTISPRHSHPHEQFVQVISGGGTLDTVDGRQRFGAGHLFHFPAEAWHAAQFDEDTILVETNLRA